MTQLSICLYACVSGVYKGIIPMKDYIMAKPLLSNGMAHVTGMSVCLFACLSVCLFLSVSVVLSVCLFV